MANELKPCPFCGGDAQIEHHEPHSHGFQAADFKMPDELLGAA